MLFSRVLLVRSSGSSSWCQLEVPALSISHSSLSSRRDTMSLKTPSAIGERQKLPAILG